MNLPYHAVLESGQLSGWQHEGQTWEKVGGNPVGKHAAAFALGLSWWTKPTACTCSQATSGGMVVQLGASCHRESAPEDPEPGSGAATYAFIQAIRRRQDARNNGVV
jgi:hypothetical protein